uniref:Uncharacterized protein n=1 Tax=Zea mays TaxID=4577 RepID=C0PLK5_MAIZE|nr:unknown [Zea mays]
MSIFERSSHAAVPSRVFLNSGMLWSSRNCNLDQSTRHDFGTTSGLLLQQLPATFLLSPPWQWLPGTGSEPWSRAWEGWPAESKVISGWSPVAAAARKVDGIGPDSAALGRIPAVWQRSACL